MEYLLTLPPKEILDKAYEYAVREDILLTMEENDLSGKQCRALLKSDAPLADVFSKFQGRDTDYMDTILDTLESHAKGLCRAKTGNDCADAR